ncbi:MAG: hypothetical protein D6775_09860, partial [Caldilineae bacterium]
ESDSALFRFGDTIELLAYRPASPELAPGETLAVDLTWRAVQQPDRDYQRFLQLLDARGQRVAGFDSAPRDGWWPTRLWEPGEHVPERVVISLPEDLAPGRYRLIVGFYRLDTLERLPVAGPAARVRDRAADLGEIRVR